MIRVRAWHYCFSHRFQSSCATYSSTCKQSKTLDYSTMAEKPSLSAGEKLAAIRALMPKHDIGFYVVLTQDEHNSEYTSAADGRRSFISGFTGSAGTAVIGLHEAALATDGRYFLQADEELDSKYWTLLKQGLPDVPTWQKWVVDKAIKSRAKIGVDPMLVGYSIVEALKKDLGPENEDLLVPISDNLVDLVWGPGKPQRSLSPIQALDLQYAGKDSRTKIMELKKTIKNAGGARMILTALDEIAWLFNLRGTDIAYNPVFFSYASVPAEGLSDPTVLYVDERKLPAQVKSLLANDKVQIKPYSAVFSDLVAYKEASSSEKPSTDSLKVLLPEGVTWALVKALSGTVGSTDTLLKTVESPVLVAKGIKNAVEVDGARKAQIIDGVAVIRYFSWLEDTIVRENKSITDYEGGQKCLEFRRQGEHFQDLSFETISSSGAQAATIHYSPAPDSKHLITTDKIYLLDSGGQYLEGTTDTTRTIHLGTPKPQEIKAYTLVLKGHIAIASAVFPTNAPYSNGYAIDILARQFLWKEGLDYRHGTGHGVGSFLNVHEGPVGIGFNSVYRMKPFLEGAILSNEPGYYEDGEYGVRIESLITVVPAKTPNNYGGVKYSTFETITQVPLCRKLIDVDRLTKEEIEWIDNYHQTVYEKTHAYLNPHELEWLKRATKPLVEL